MKAIKTKTLIVSLIKDDLIYNKLILGLGDIGIDALNYHLHLSETIFKLMNITDDESTSCIFKYYLAELKKAKRFKISGAREQFDALALSIYTELERRRNNAS